MRRTVLVSCSSLALLLATGCAGLIETKVTERAVTDMSCAEAELDVRRRPGTGSVMPTAYDANCNGQQAYYEGGCNLFGMCRIYSETEVAQYQQQQAAQRAAYQEQQQAQQASQPAASSGGGDGGAPVPAQTASVSLKNVCGQTVKLFFGDKPKFGSGRSSSIGSNTLQSASMGVGDTVWIVDDSGNGIASYTASAGSQRIEVNCGGFRRAS